MFLALVSARIFPTLRDTDVVTGSLAQKSVEFQSIFVNDKMSLAIVPAFVSILAMCSVNGNGAVLPW